jgi:hypothetical protein
LKNLHTLEEARHNTEMKNDAYPKEMSLSDFTSAYI